VADSDVREDLVRAAPGAAGRRAGLVLGHAARAQPRAHRALGRRLDPDHDGDAHRSRRRREAARRRVRPPGPRPSRAPRAGIARGADGGERAPRPRRNARRRARARGRGRHRSAARTARVRAQGRAARGVLRRAAREVGSYLMKVLVMGGTQFNGLALVRELVRTGHDVSICNRGKTAAELPRSVQRLIADRTDHAALRAALAGRDWDCVFDISAYRPEDARAMSEILRGRTGHYVFASSTVIYAPSDILPIAEDHPLDLSERQNDYGRNKILCEELLLRE